MEATTSDLAAPLATVSQLAGTFTLEEWFEVLVAGLPVLCLLYLFLSWACCCCGTSPKVAPGDDSSGAPSRPSRLDAALGAPSTGGALDERIAALVKASTADVLASNAANKKALEKAIALLSTRLDDTNAKLDKLMAITARSAVPPVRCERGAAAAASSATMPPPAPLPPAAKPAAPSSSSSFRAASPGAPPRGGKAPAALGSSSARAAGQGPSSNRQPKPPPRASSADVNL